MLLVCPVCEDIQDVLDEDTAGNLQKEIDNCVKMDASMLKLDTTSGATQDDTDLYSAIVAIGWESEVITV